MYNIPTFATTEQKRSKGNIWKIISLIITLLLIIILLIIINTSYFYKINGTSMYPTLKQNEYVFCLKQFQIERGDIVAFNNLGNNVIKRIIGLPGETIDIKDDGTIIINDKALEEEYLNNKVKGDVEINLPYKIPENSYFVLGDNRADSLDSRYNSIGTINIDEIICEVHGIM